MSVGSNACWHSCTRIAPREVHLLLFDDETSKYDESGYLPVLDLHESISGSECISSQWTMCWLAVSATCPPTSLSGGTNLNRCLLLHMRMQDQQGPLRRRDRQAATLRTGSKSACANLTSPKRCGGRVSAWLATEGETHHPEAFRGSRHAAMSTAYATGPEIPVVPLACTLQLACHRCQHEMTVSGLQLHEKSKVREVLTSADPPVGLRVHGVKRPRAARISRQRGDNSSPPPWQDLPRVRAVL